ncbi:putative WRKY transcription factor 75 [Acorus calamus]|uniref:WRKY transcription factor 75 n=1 Tax=Acorus calamus TaxID=4465 RepID=A0AAV9DXU5_ACOCL|nr:putative WRKY transcription factor 75 [Acorus calamus]
MLFRLRSQVDILDDGYRWRKYGQKSVKNNTFPRSYYRCTHQGCNVKKQIQRLSRDEGVVVTTYEGVHTHPTQKSNNDNFEHILSQMQIYPAGF